MVGVINGEELANDRRKKLEIIVHNCGILSRVY